MVATTSDESLLLYSDISYKVDLLIIIQCTRSRRQARPISHGLRTLNDNDILMSVPHTIDDSEPDSLHLRLAYRRHDYGVLGPLRDRNENQTLLLRSWFCDNDLSQIPRNVQRVGHSFALIVIYSASAS